jgi:hypothetical protein
MFSFDFFAKASLLIPLFFFFIFFILCSYWAVDYHPERKLTIGFLISLFYTFWLLVFQSTILILLSFLFAK